MAKWDILPEESPEEYQMFLRYRGQSGKRSVTKAVADSATDKALIVPGEPLSHQLVTKWLDTAAHHQWAMRARAWDEYMARTQADAEEEEIRAMRHRHLEQSHVLQKSALLRFVERNEETGEPIFEKGVGPDGTPYTHLKIKPMESDADAIRAMKLGVNMERIVHNLPVELLAADPTFLQQRYQQLTADLNADDEAVEGEIRELDSGED